MEDEFRKRLRDMSNYGGSRNYRTQIDTFMPHCERIIVDRPVHPSKKLEEAELAEEYERIWQENGIPAIETQTMIEDNIGISGKYLENKEYLLMRGRKRNRK